MMWSSTVLPFLFCLWTLDFVCGAIPDDPSDCTNDRAALYHLTFRGTWSKEAFPRDYPLYRPPAQWSKLVGRTHGSNYTLWRVGEAASPALAELADYGKSKRLDMEPQGWRGLLDAFVTSPLPAGVGRSKVSVIADPDHSKLSVASKFIPSPDWFTGVDTLELCQRGKWVHEMTVELPPMDAGTRRGLIYTSPKWAERTPKGISVITSSSPSHPAASFFYPNLKSLPPIAILTVTRVKTYGFPNARNKTAIEISVPHKEQAPHKGPRPGLVKKTDTNGCALSPWGEWSACSKTCGYGSQARQRKVTGPIVCGSPVGTRLCGSMRNCRWKHFGPNRWSSRRSRPSRVSQTQLERIRKLAELRRRKRLRRMSHQAQAKSHVRY